MRTMVSPKTVTLPVRSRKVPTLRQLPVPVLGVRLRWLSIHLAWVRLTARSLPARMPASSPRTSRIRPNRQPAPDRPQTRSNNDRAPTATRRLRQTTIASACSTPLLSSSQVARPPRPLVDRLPVKPSNLPPPPSALESTRSGRVPSKRHKRKLSTPC